MYKVVSESDLAVKYKNWDTAEVLLRPQLFLKVLWQEGIDVRQEVELQEGLNHRNNAGKIVNCPRWVGLERTDQEWIRSDRASLEIQYFTADASTKSDMRMMIGHSDNGAFEKQDREEMSFTLKLLGNIEDIDKSDRKNPNTN